MSASAVPDLLPKGFRTRADELPRSKPPAWMTWMWVVALFLTAGSLSFTLLGPMDEFVLATGEVRPADYELVFPQTSGVLSEVSAHPGMPVKAGEVMARLDAADLEREAEVNAAALGRARSDLANTEALLAQTRAAPVPLDQLLLASQTERLREALALRRDLLHRLEGLEQPNAVSQVELIRERLNVKQAESELARCETAKGLVDGEYAIARLTEAEAKVANAKAAIAALEAERKRIETEQERRIIRAPSDGLVVSGSVRFPGERAETGSALYKLARGERVRIRLYASEDRVTRIKGGMLVRFRTKADPDRLTPSSIGRVTEVALDRFLTRDDGASTVARGGYAIDVDVEAATTALPLGAAIDAEIVLDQRPFWRLMLLKHEAQAATPMK